VEKPSEHGGHERAEQDFYCTTHYYDPLDWAVFSAPI
jgi:hypothetical protein